MNTSTHFSDSKNPPSKEFDGARKPAMPQDQNPPSSLSHFKFVRKNEWEFHSVPRRWLDSRFVVLSIALLRFIKASSSFFRHRVEIERGSTFNCSFLTRNSRDSHAIAFYLSFFFFPSKKKSKRRILHVFRGTRICFTVFLPQHTPPSALPFSQVAFRTWSVHAKHRLVSRSSSTRSPAIRCSSLPASKICVEHHQNTIASFFSSERESYVRIQLECHCRLTVPLLTLVFYQRDSLHASIPD